MPEEAEPIVEPSRGRVLGHSWGAPLDEVRARHPEARAETGSGDVRRLSVTHHGLLADVPIRVAFVFRLDELVAVELRIAEEASQGGAPVAMHELAELVTAGFEAPPEPRGELFSERVEERTRLAVDLLDGFVRLEDAEA